ncbi:MAG: response regulator [Bacteroidetes bacterium]|nr:response regulator [Bacteroidota bacterium]
MKKIVIIEDEDLIREGIVLILKVNGYEVLTAHNGEVGITVAKEHLPDLIISDIMMPIKDGYDVLEALRNYEPTSTVPFLFLSAKADQSDIRRGMNLGADDYLTKPFDHDELINAVNTRLVKHEEVRRKAEIDFAADRARFEATSEILNKILPSSIATRLISGEKDIADYFESISILFADIAGFTPISAQMPAQSVVRLLNFVFGEFDRIMKIHGCEKIKTIGDGYMAVAGAPIRYEDHAARIAAAALEMVETTFLPDEIHKLLPENTTFSVKIGIHTGAAIAGVFGEERFVYDVYSDAVNTAARMESHGEAGKIHVSEDFVTALHQTINLSDINMRIIERGQIEIKGKGLMKTYFLEKTI